MPNTPLLLGCGASALAQVAPTTEEEFSFCCDIFRASGEIAVIDGKTRSTRSFRSMAARRLIFTRSHSILWITQRNREWIAEVALRSFARP